MVGDSIVKAFQNYRADPLATAVPICSVVECLTVACPREEVAAIETSRKIGIRKYVGASRNRGVDIPCP